MTERTRAGMDGGSWADVQIRAAIGRGDFDNLPGAGKPLARGDELADESWWFRDYLRREDVPADALLPPSLRLRRRIEELPETVSRLSSERAVRATVDALNEEIGQWLRAPIGPWRRVATVDVDAVVRQWHDRRRDELPAGATPAPPARSGASRRRWWHRRVLRWAGAVNRRSDPG